MSVLSDDTPEINEEYQLKLSSVTTEGKHFSNFYASVYVCVYACMHACVHACMCEQCGNSSVTEHQTHDKLWVRFPAGAVGEFCLLESALCVWNMEYLLKGTRAKRF